eukprot:GEMP01044699.1.p1 GENE.GEMP01044699.1~~GEMP01044699.1.p1  ORF type:complete len:314 (+),score=76.07 GEMP01044699.1:96-1037(+)
MTSKKAIIQLSCGDYSDSLYFSDESITSRPDECMASILEEANKLADGPAQVRYKLGEVTRYLSSACLPEFLEMLSLGQCTNGVTMMSLEVVPVDVIDLVSENESEIDEFHDVPSLPATPNTNEQLQGIDEGEKSDGSWEFANEIKEEPQEEEEPKKAEPEPAAGPAPNPTQHIVQHIMAVVTQQLPESPVVVACDTTNSLVDPEDLVGPMVSFIQEEYNLDGAFLVGQFNSSSHSRVRFLNRGSTPIENAALHLCYGDGMGFEGIEFGTIGAGEAFEVLMDLTMTTGERKGMSCWAFTTNDRPIGSLICAEAC